MAKIIEAIYEDNLIKPLEKIRVKSKFLTLVILEKKKSIKKRKMFLKKLKPINIGRKVKMREILKYMDKLENLEINKKIPEEKYYEKFSDQ